ncbi:MAG: ZIP family metal transporter [Synergistetes bacterium]|nr:ZIP family metal transporter [Synergistota bacterium]
MEGFLSQLSPPMQALLATLFTWGVTALGASGVFLFKEVNKKVLDTMLGFAAGVMISASYFSLLAPAIEMSIDLGVPSWFPSVLGFILGGLFLYIVDKLVPHLHLGFPDTEKEGVKTTWRRTTLLILAITIHNIPEGLAVGVAFGAVSIGIESASFASAIALAVGIGLQNFPEGMAVSLPLRREGFSPFKGFFYGQLSGVVEPIAGVFGAWAVTIAKPLLPYALSFAAGAMIYVVVEELIPEAQKSGETDLPTVGAMLGFAVMMFLDVFFS